MATIKVQVTALATVNDRYASNGCNEQSSPKHEGLSQSKQSTSSMNSTPKNVSSKSGSKISVVSETPTSSKTHTNRQKQEKVYRVRNPDWYCIKCDIYCNSSQQFAIHMMGQVHRDDHVDAESSPKEIKTENGNRSNNNDSSAATSLSQSLIDEEAEEEEEEEEEENVSNKNVHDNSIAIDNHIDASKYLIPEEKKVGKFEKFGFYCAKCDAYMTGQIQLIMHVKGSKHYYYSPNEIPGYKPTKPYSPKTPNSNYEKQRTLRRRIGSHVNYDMTTPVSLRESSFYVLKNACSPLLNNFAFSSDHCKRYFYQNFTNSLDQDTSSYTFYDSSIKVPGQKYYAATNQNTLITSEDVTYDCYSKTPDETMSNQYHARHLKPHQNKSGNPMHHHHHHHHHHHQQQQQQQQHIHYSPQQQHKKQHQQVPYAKSSVSNGIPYSMPHQVPQAQSSKLSVFSHQNQHGYWMSQGYPVYGNNSNVEFNQLVDKSDSTKTSNHHQQHHHHSPHMFYSHMPTLPPLSQPQPQQQHQNQNQQVPNLGYMSSSPNAQYMPSNQQPLQQRMQPNTSLCNDQSSTAFTTYFSHAVF